MAAQCTVRCPVSRIAGGGQGPAASSPSWTRWVCPCCCWPSTCWTPTWWVQYSAADRDGPGLPRQVPGPTQDTSERASAWRSFCCKASIQIFFSIKIFFYSKVFLDPSQVCRDCVAQGVLPAAEGPGGGLAYNIFRSKYLLAGASGEQLEDGGCQQRGVLQGKL